MKNKERIGDAKCTDESEIVDTTIPKTTSAYIGNAAQQFDPSGAAVPESKQEWSDEWIGESGTGYAIIHPIDFKAHCWKCAKAIAAAHNAALAEERQKAVTDFATRILHGDEVHRAWLLEAAQSYCDGFDIPQPRSAPITDADVNEAWEELLAELDVGFIIDNHYSECNQCGAKSTEKEKIKHKEGCIQIALDKVSNANRKAFAAERQKREEAEEELVGFCDELRDELAKERAAAAKAVEALKLNMEWIGKPPTSEHDFDSLREDAWAKGKAAIAFYEQGSKT